MAAKKKAGPKAKRKPGRPPEAVPTAMSEQLLDWLHDGGSLLAFCKKAGHPKARTISDWRAKDPEFATAYARAREEGAAIRFEKAGEIVRKANAENWQVARLQAEHEYRAARSFCPAVFGDKAQLQHTGTVSLERLIAESFTEGE